MHTPTYFLLLIATLTTTFFHQVHAGGTSSTTNTDTTSTNPGTNTTAGDPGRDRTMQVVNLCKDTIWPGIYGLPRPAGIPFNGGWEMKSGDSVSFTLPGNWYSGRIWARTDCTTDPTTGNFNCLTGSCGPKLPCEARTGEPNVSLAEFTFVPNGADIFDLSNVDAYNVGIQIVPVGGTPVDPNNVYDNCGSIKCSIDLNANAASVGAAASAGYAKANVNGGAGGKPDVVNGFVAGGNAGGRPLRGMVIDGKVIDCTKFLDEHPGGEEVLMEQA
ncbi:hypothetical protein HDU76_012230, partial [Blyttiomyces sp. JEL0837]